jgi:hypothetical protein
VTSGLRKGNEIVLVCSAAAGLLGPGLRSTAAGPLGPGLRSTATNPLKSPGCQPLNLIVAIAKSS